MTCSSSSCNKLAGSTEGLPTAAVAAPAVEAEVQQEGTADLFISNEMEK